MHLRRESVEKGLIAQCRLSESPGPMAACALCGLGASGWLAQTGLAGCVSLDLRRPGSDREKGFNQNETTAVTHFVDPEVGAHAAVFCKPANIGCIPTTY